MRLIVKVNKRRLFGEDRVATIAGNFD
jgi:hypothetical protein